MINTVKAANTNMPAVPASPTCASSQTVGPEAKIALQIMRNIANKSMEKAKVMEINMSRNKE